MELTEEPDNYDTMDGWITVYLNGWVDYSVCSRLFPPIPPIHCIIVVRLFGQLHALVDTYRCGTTFAEVPIIITADCHPDGWSGYLICKYTGTATRAEVLHKLSN